MERAAADFSGCGSLGKRGRVVFSSGRTSSLPKPSERKRPVPAPTQWCVRPGDALEVEASPRATPPEVRSLIPREKTKGHPTTPPPSQRGPPSTLGLGHRGVTQPAPNHATSRRRLPCGCASPAVRLASPRDPPVMMFPVASFTLRSQHEVLAVDTSLRPSGSRRASLLEHRRRAGRAGRIGLAGRRPRGRRASGPASPREALQRR